jgi:hypothetical protein
MHYIRTRTPPFLPFNDLKPSDFYIPANSVVRPRPWPLRCRLHVWPDIPAEEMAQWRELLAEGELMGTRAGCPVNGSAPMKPYHLQWFMAAATADSSWRPPLLNARRKK